VKDSVSQAGISSTFSEAQVAGMFPARELKMNPAGVAMTFELLARKRRG
jgi:hypothetical protein